MLAKAFIKDQKTSLPTFHGYHFKLASIRNIERTSPARIFRNFSSVILIIHIQGDPDHWAAMFFSGTVNPIEIEIIRTYLFRIDIYL